MASKSHPGVDEYLDRLPTWQRELCSRLRTLIHEADPDIDETVKRSVQPYFVLNGNVCALLAAKDHVNLFIYDPTVPDPDGLINQGHGNSTARTVQFHADDPVNGPALLALIRAVAARNKAGGWRRLDSPR